MRRSCLVLALLVCASTAAGQDRWVFVPALLPGETVSTTALETSLADGRVQANRAAALTVEARHSSAAPQLDQAQVRRALELVKRVTATVRSSNRGDRVGRRLQRELDQLEAPLKDFLQRDAKSAEILFQSCVAAAGLLIKEDPAETNELLSTCARTYPGQTPRAAPNVLRAYEEARAAVAAEPHGALEVSGGEGCAVRLNGALLGTTPLHVDAVRVGTARIQVECGDSPGRSHGIPIEPGSHQRLVIHPEFEQALRTTPGLSLSYLDAAQRDRWMTKHGELLSEILQAHVVLLVPTDGDRVRALSLQPNAELGTLSTTHISPASLSTLRNALGPVRTAPPPPLLPDVAEPAVEEDRPRPSPPRPPPPSADTGKSTASVVAGGTLIALGLGSIVTAWVFYGQRVDTRAMATGSFAERDDYRADGLSTLGFAAGGGVLLAGAEYLLLNSELSVPTSAWIWAGGGALLTATGIGLMIANSQCSLPGAQCRGLTSDVTFGALVALHSIPLLAVPLNYALQIWLRPTRRIELGLQGTHATMTYRF